MNNDSDNPTASHAGSEPTVGPGVTVPLTPGQYRHHANSDDVSAAAAAAAAAGNDLELPNPAAQGRGGRPRLPRGPGLPRP